MKTESWDSVLRIGIATEAKYSEPNQLWFDDRCLKEELERRGHRIEVINWRASDVRLHDFDAIFVSSTWDIPCDPQGFFDWLDRCESDGVTRLINAATSMRDNVVKSRYLTDLIHKFGDQSRKTGSITPSRFYAAQAAPLDGIEGLGDRTLNDILRGLERDDGNLDDEKACWRGRDIVIKPIISADGRDTLVHRRSSSEARQGQDLLDAEAAQQHFDKLVRDTDRRGAILQPYIQAIEKGEYSLTFFNDTFGHSIQKPAGFKAAAGGTRRPVAREELPDGMFEFSIDLIRFMQARYGELSLTRTRIDLVQEPGESRGPVLCEFECTEPNTNLKCVDPSSLPSVIQRYADAIEQRSRESAFSKLR